MATIPGMGAEQVRALNAIDLFAGPGGLTTGLKQAGYKVLGAVEIDDLAVRTYKSNHPEVRISHGSIRDLDPKSFLEDLGVRRGELDLLAGGPPCQGFSSTRTLNGSRPVEDDRNELIEVFADWIEALEPRAVLLENVPGLVKSAEFRALVHRLTLLGYPVESSTSVVNAQHYGIPQRRRRLVLMGIRNLPLTFERPDMPLATVRDAIGSMPMAGKSGDPLHDLPERRSERVRRVIAAIPKNGGSRSALEPGLTLECHKATDGFKDVYGRMSWDLPAPTITGGCFNPSKGRFLHPEEDRCISLREAALLQGFDASYHFSLEKGKQAAARMIGNALPPAFVAVHAGALADHLIPQDPSLTPSEPGA